MGASRDRTGNEGGSRSIGMEGVFQIVAEGPLGETRF